MSTVRFTGRSEDDAVRKAARELGCPVDKLNYQVAARTGGLLGMLGQVITIEVTIGEGAEESRQTPPAYPAREPRGESVLDVLRAAPKSAAREEWFEEDDDESSGNRREEEPAELSDDDYVPGNAIESEAAEKEPARAPSQRKRPRRDGREPRRQPERQPRRRGGEESHSGPVDPELIRERSERAVALLNEFFTICEAEVKATAEVRGPEINLTLTGELPDWFGKPSESVGEALQFLANKVVNRFPPRYRISFGRPGIPEESLERLEEAAEAVGRKVAQSNTPFWIVPLSPKQRRIVHMAAARSAGVATRSVGDGTGRRLCIYLGEESE